MNKSKKVLHSRRKCSGHRHIRKTVFKFPWNSKQPLTRRAVVLLSAAFVLLLSGGIAAGIQHHRNKTLSTAFYGLPDPVVKELTNQIREIKPGHTEFAILPPEKELPHNITKKYDILFTWTGKRTELLAEKVLEPQKQLYNLFPSAIRKAGHYNGKYYAVPLLLDNYELAFYRTYRNMAKLQLPVTLDNFEAYLRSIKKYADTPLLCAGADDATLTGLVSALTESMGGSSGYAALVRQLGSSGDLQAALSIRLAPEITFSSVLDKIKSWQKDGLIHPKWYEATDQDVLMFMKDHLSGVLFMTLSEHRKKPLVLIKYYDSVRFPDDPAVKDHALVAPVLAGLPFRNPAGEQDVLEHLVFAQNQEKLSTASKLGPAASRAEAHDRQADDVRFWAASCPGGPIPDLAAAAFSTRQQAAAFAAAIREYLKK